MAQQRRKTTTKRKPTTRRRKNDFTLNWVGLAFSVVGVFALFRLGLIGTVLANCFRLVVGNTFLFAAAVFTAFGLWLLFSGVMPRIRKRVLWGAGLTYAALLPILTSTTMQSLDQHAHYLQITWTLLSNDFALLTTASDVGGGLVGGALYSVLAPLLSRIGAIVVCVVLMIVGLLIIFDVQASQVFVLCRRIGHGIGTGAKALHAKQATARQAKAKTQQTSAPATPATKTPQPAGAEPTDQELPTPVTAREDDDFTINMPPQAKAAPSTNKPAATPQPTKGEQLEMFPPAEAKTEDPSGFATETGAAAADYELPSMALLSAPDNVDQSTEYNAIKTNRVKLKETLASFGVDVNVKSATLGPSITQYEIQPAIGVKVSKIVHLSDDLALALAAKDIRIEAPIPGKSLIGIEVPNQHVATVGYRDVLAHTPKHPGKPLVIPLGKDVNGQVLTCDLTKMPHLLIAGATGSGKSVMINVIITSILMTAKPTDVRLVLIDPKRVELSVYDGVPHLLTPVVTEAKKAPSALNKVVDEMNRRYERFAAAGVRNMGEYNKKVQEAAEPGMTKMPFIVVIVDELSDLMMVAGAEVETAIVRLAQMARAAGIHIIIATQRPSVDVITGLIKANIPSRIAFAVSSGVDSRTILDSVGAEKLLGRGDMLYAPLDASKPVRIQGAFIPSADVEAVVKAITDQVAPAYEEEMAPTDPEEASENADSEDDLYDEAKAFVIQQQSASTSMLQRRFRIGYNRAARLIDDLEKNQVVGPSEGSKPRKVYAQAQPTEQ